MCGDIVSSEGICVCHVFECVHMCECVRHDDAVGAGAHSVLMTVYVIEMFVCTRASADRVCVCECVPSGGSAEGGVLLIRHSLIEVFGMQAD